MKPVATLHFDKGLFAEIHVDHDVEQPFGDDEAVRIVVLHRRYIDPSNGSCGRDPDEVAAWERENARDWFVIPLFLYDHSGTVYAPGRSNPFHCPWDSGRVGIVALKRSEWGNGKEPDEKLIGYAAGIAAQYTSWANGECYGYVLLDAAGEELDSCWGFIGFDAAEAEAKVAAAHSLTVLENEPAA
jgi:hypothetical protein